MGLALVVVKASLVNHAYIEDRTWDTTRHVHDYWFVDIATPFITLKSITVERCQNASKDCDEIWRPEAITKTIKIIRRDLKPIDRTRYLDILHKMQLDPMLWFYCSW